MMRHLDLMHKYPRRTNRLSERKNPSESDKEVARLFGHEYFDGDRSHGYGGYFYDPKFWAETVRVFADFFGLTNGSSILDIGCAKGFMLTEFKKLLPNLVVCGVDISDYAIEHSHPLVKSNLLRADCRELPFKDKSFDFVFSINTIHNVDKDECILSIKEIERVKKFDSYVVVDGWQTTQEKRDLDSWVLTAKTVLSDSEWEELFATAGYTGIFSFWKVQ